MSKNDLMLVSFKPNKEHFMAFFLMEQFLSSERDLEPVLKEASQLYEHSIKRMQSVINEINTFRKERRLLPARVIWKLGNLIFKLVRNLEKLSLQIDGIYDHLVRDLNVKRKWLEKVIIFRRYLPNQFAIPESLNWGRCEKGTRRAAEKLQEGMNLN